jgi:o-succinylbenzoate synthase
MMEYEPFSLRLASPLKTAAGRIDAREGFLIRIDCDGHRGVGEATPLPGWTETYDECEAALAGAVDGRGDFDPSTPAARHGVELARVDAAARASGESLAAWLADGTPAGSVPVNATVGDAPAEETAAATRQAVEAGYRAVKVKVGARPPDDDIARLRAVRAAAGDDVELRADANGAWDRTAAERVLDAAADLDFAYVEQPLPASDLAGHAALRGRGVDVAVDESLVAAGPEAVLEHGAADVVICKPMALGGPVRTHDVARRAADHGVDAVVTTTIDGAVARVGALYVAAALPNVRACGLATGDRLATDLAADPASVEHGALRVPAGPGLAGSAFDALRAGDQPTEDA